MLTGQAKTYQRECMHEYMRRERAGKLPKRDPAKPKKFGLLDDLLDTDPWLQKRRKLKRKLVYANDIDEMVRILREYKAEAKAKRAAKEAKEAKWYLEREHSVLRCEADRNDWKYSQWPKQVFTCIFCDKTSEKFKLMGNGLNAICRDCAMNAVRILESNGPKRYQSSSLGAIQSKGWAISNSDKRCEAN
jgi:hypothetical protein